MKRFAYYLTLLLCLCTSIPMWALEKTISIQQELAALETSAGGRLGVFAINTANQDTIQYHANQRFPFCSTGKLMVVGAILQKNMSNPDLLKQNISYNKQDLITYSPITEQYISQGMTIASLCAAALDYSDNTAANLLIKQLGGPKSVNVFARSIDDKAFRLDRIEPQLNSAIPGDLRDTTTPLAMASSLQKLALGQALGQAERQQLQAWLKANTTGNARIRAGVPKGWIVGDKTGTGDYGTTNDVGIIWPPHCSPIIVAIYFTQNQKNTLPKDAVLASATRLIIKAFRPTDACLAD